MKRSGERISRPFKRKTGRTELRQTTKFVRRGPKLLQKEPEADEESEQSEQEEGEQVGDEPVKSTSAKAYSALLALLGTEIEEPEETAEQKTEESEVESDEHEEDVALEDELPESEDEREPAPVDFFQFHFNDEDRIEKEISKLDTKAKIVLDKFSEDGYLVTSTGYNCSRIEYPAKQPQFWNAVNLKRKVKVQFEKETLSNLNFSWVRHMLAYQNVNLQHFQNADLGKNYRKYYLLHCLNHVLRTRDAVLSNNEKKQRYLKKLAEGASAQEPELRDQGYTRGKVLILLPTRNAAWEVVSLLIEIAQMDSVENKSRFKSQYYSGFTLDSVKDKRPEDFVNFFRGNSDDFFSIGIKFTRKTMKLYSTFLQSDIIIASPLGLKVLLEGDGKKKFKDKSNGFLSSIEVAVLDETHGLLMQNWEHVTTIFNKYLGKPPSSRSEELAKTIDFSRVRMWAINDQCSFLTQVLSFAKYSTPEINNLVSNKSRNMAGITTVKPVVTHQNSQVTLQRRRLLRGGVLSKDVSLKQVFTRFDVESPLEDSDRRLAHFKNVVLAQVRTKASYNTGTLVYIPSYVDYIRVKNYLQSETNISFLAIDEYSSQADLTRNRALFERKASSYPFMLYTERLHFYKRYNIRGVRNVVFYGPPTDPVFYSEVLDFIVKNKIKTDLAMVQEELEDASETEPIDLNLAMVRVMLSRFDRLKLEKIVGARAAGEVCLSKSEMYEFK